MSSTPGHQVLPTHPLEIPEILQKIFEQLQNKDNGATLLVSRQWFNVCERIFWRHLESASDFERMLVLLGEVADSGPDNDASSPYNRMSLDRYPIHQKWENFEKHSAFIHSIHLPSLHPYVQACNHIALNRPHHNLFPSLRTVTYKDGSDDSEFGLEYLRLFMAETLLHFSVHLPKMEASSASWSSIQVIESISVMSNLQYLEITCRNLSKVGVGSLAGVLQGLQKLEVLVLPPYRAVGTIINQLATHGSIKEIRSKDALPKDAYGADHSFSQLRLLRSSDVEEPSFGRDAFQTLTFLTFSGNPIDVKKLVLNGGEHFPPTIRCLHVEISKKEFPQELNSLFRVMGERCSALVDFRYSDTSEVMIHPSLSPSGAVRARDLAFKTLRPILSHSLVSLHIAHHAPLQWSADHLRTLASLLPRVESLVLNHRPLERPSKPLPPIQALSSFAQGCLNLKHMAIYMDASVPFILQESERQPFRELATLNLGWSPISRESLEDVVVMLAQLLPPTCAIIIEQGFRFALEARQPSLSLWEDVIRNRRMLLRMQSRMDPLMISRGIQTEG